MSNRFVKQYALVWTADNDDNDARKLQAASATGNAVTNDNEHHDEVFPKFSIYFFVFILVSDCPRYWDSKLSLNR